MKYKLIVGLILAGAVASAVGGAYFHSAKENILYSNEFLDEKGTPTVAYAYKSGELAPKLDNEIMDKRTEHIVTRDLGNGNFSAQSGYDFYKEGNDWKQVKFATTTKKVFDKESFASWLINKAFANKVFASSQGGLNPNTVENDASVGTAPWNNPELAGISDNMWAGAATSDNPFVTYYLKATDFGFSIPAGMAINGILVEVKSYGDPYDAVYDYAVRIVKGGNIGSTDKQKGAWPELGVYGQGEVMSYGSSSDLWGETWEYSDINASNFGFAISASLGGLNNAAAVDGISITVYYSAIPPTVTTQSASSVTRTSAALNGNITEIGNANATIRGFAYGTDSTLAAAIATTTENGSFSVGAFTRTIAGLACGTTYYFRAYATNSAGTGFGAISVPFTASACAAQLPPPPPPPPAASCAPLYLTPAHIYTQQNSNGTVTKFTRTIQAIDVSPNEEKIVSTVSWSFHGIPYSVTITDHLTPWQ